MSDVFLGDRLIETITYWGFPVPDGFGGGNYPAPVTFKARWLDKQEIFIDATGREVRSNAFVFCSRDVVIGGYLYHGSSGVLNPIELDGAREIRGFTKVSGLEVRQYVRKAFL